MRQAQEAISVVCLLFSVFCFSTACFAPVSSQKNTPSANIQLKILVQR